MNKSVFAAGALTFALLSPMVRQAHADTWVYVTNNLTDSVSVIDTGSNTVIATLPVGSKPEGVGAHLGAKGATVYVANHGYVGEYGNTISVIRGLKVDGTITVGSGPRGVAVHPNGGFVYVANAEEDTLSVVDVGAGSTVATVPVGVGPAHVAVHPDGTFVYVSNEGSDTVSVISAASKTLVDTIDAGPGPHGVDIDPSGSPLYVANAGSDTLTVIDTTDNTVIDTIPVGECPSQPAVHPSGDFVYVTSGCNSYTPHIVSVVDTATGNVVDTVTVGPEDYIVPHGIEVEPDGSNAYVANVFTDKVVVIDTVTNNLVPTPFLTLPDGPSVGNLPVDIAILDGLCIDPVDTDDDGIGDACDPDDDNDGCQDGVDDEPKSDTQVVGSWIGVFCNPRSGAVYGSTGVNSDNDAQLDCQDDDDDNDGIPDDVDGCPTSGMVICTQVRSCPGIPWWYRCGPECVENLVVYETVSNPAPLIIDTYRVVNETLYLKPPGGTSVESLARALSAGGPVGRASAAELRADSEPDLGILSIWSKDAFGRPDELITVVAEYEPSAVRAGELGQGGWLALTPSPDGTQIENMASAWSPGAGPGVTLTDHDGDGLADPFDNCLGVPNASLDVRESSLWQLDTDGDSFGNACDPDFDQDGSVDENDLAMLSCVLHGRCESSPDLDMDGDGSVGRSDLRSWRRWSSHGLPGPSGLLEPFAVSLPPSEAE